jgi:hypothetical protein
LRFLGHPIDSDFGSSASTVLLVALTANAAGSGSSTSIFRKEDEFFLEVIRRDRLQVISRSATTGFLSLSRPP